MMSIYHGVIPPRLKYVVENSVLASSAASAEKGVVRDGIAATSLSQKRGE